MKLWLKYILSLPKKEQILFLEILQKIEQQDFDGLEMKKLEGFKTLYRIRIGGRRIVLRKTSNAYDIVKIGPRWDVYKDLRE